jgi:hypothetical protein
MKYADYFGSGLLEMQTHFSTARWQTNASGRSTIGGAGIANSSKVLEAQAGCGGAAGCDASKGDTRKPTPKCALTDNAPKSRSIPPIYSRLVLAFWSLCLLFGLELLLDNFPRLFFPPRRVILLAGQTQVGGQGQVQIYWGLDGRFSCSSLLIQVKVPTKMELNKNLPH